MKRAASKQKAKLTERGVSWCLAGVGLGSHVGRWVRVCGKDCAPTAFRAHVLPNRLEAVTAALWHGYGAQA